MKRASATHPTVVAAAVSQATSLDVLGIDARRYLQHLREHPEIPRRRVGRLVVSAVASWVPRDEREALTPRRQWSVDAAIAKAVSS